MRIKRIPLYGLLIVILSGCVSVGKIGRHDFDSGFYKLKVQGAAPSRVYAEVIEDSIIVYPVNSTGRKEFPNTSSSSGIKISRIKTDNYYYKASFINKSVNIDLTSIIFKSRSSMDDVPN